MPSAGSFPSTVTTSGTGVDWTNPTRVTANDNSNATLSLSQGSPDSRMLNCTGINPDIPAGSTIDGIVVAVERQFNASGLSIPSGLLKFRLIIEGTPVGDTKELGPYQTVAMGAVSAGATDDLWGLTPTAAQVNAATSGVEIWVDGTFGGLGTLAVAMDYVTVTYHYTEPEPSSSEEEGTTVRTGSRWVKLKPSAFLPPP